MALNTDVEDIRHYRSMIAVESELLDKYHRVKDRHPSLTDEFDDAIERSIENIAYYESRIVQIIEGKA